MIFHPDKIPSTPRVNRAGGQQTMVTTVLSFLAIVWNQGIQTVTISQGTCNFTPFAGNPMTEMVSISVAGSAYFMVGAQGGSTTSKILDLDCSEKTNYLLAETGSDIAVWPEGSFTSGQSLVAARTDTHLQTTVIRPGTTSIEAITSSTVLTGTPVSGTGLQRRLINSGTSAFLITCMFKINLILEKIDINMATATQYATTVPDMSIVSARLVIDDPGSNFVLLVNTPSSYIIIVYPVSTMTATKQFDLGGTFPSTPVYGVFRSGGSGWPNFIFTSGAILYEMNLDTTASGPATPSPVYTSTSTIGQIVMLRVVADTVLLTHYDSSLVSIVGLKGEGMITSANLNQKVTAVVYASTQSTETDFRDNFFFIVAPAIDFSLGWSLSKQSAVKSTTASSSDGSISFSDCSASLLVQTNSWDSNSRTFTIKFNDTLLQVNLTEEVTLISAQVTGDPTTSSAKIEKEFKEAEYSDLAYTSDGKGITGRMKLPTKETDVWIGIGPKSGTQGIKGVDKKLYCNVILIKVGEYIPRPEQVAPLTTAQKTVQVAYRVVTATTVMTAATIPAFTSAASAATASTNTISSQSGIRKIIKLIDSLNYLTALNGARLTLADRFLESFRENPMSIEMNFFEFEDDQIRCEPSPQFSREGFSCNALNNHGNNATSFLLYSGTLLICALVAKLLSKISDQKGLWYKIPYWVFWLPSKLITFEFLLEFFDGNQIESWRFALLNLNNYNPNPAQKAGLAFSIILLILYGVYGICISIKCYHKCHETEDTPIKWLMNAGEKLQWMDGMFEDFLSPDEIPHKVLYYMPFWQYVKVIATQSLLVFLSDVSMDQLKYIFLAEFPFTLMSFSCIHLRGLFKVWAYRAQCCGFVLILFFYLLHDYTASSSSPARQAAYSIILIVLSSVILLVEFASLVSDQVGIVKEAWTAWKAEKAPLQHAKKMDTVGDSDGDRLNKKEDPNQKQDPHEKDDPNQKEDQADTKELQVLANQQQENKQSTVIIGEDPPV